MSDRPTVTMRYGAVHVRLPDDCPCDPVIRVATKGETGDQFGPGVHYVRVHPAIGDDGTLIEMVDLEDYMAEEQRRVALTMPLEAALADAHVEEGGQCLERCLGVEGHVGVHQTSDYPAILAAERRATVERIRQRLEALTDVGTAYVKRSRFVAILDEEAAR